MPDEQQQASPGYAFGQLERALRMAAEHDDPATRERARAKAERWRAVLAGMTDGRLTVGSRTPVADTPAWVTLEVAHGGFATGRLLAEAPLSDDESARVAALPPGSPGSPGDTERERLNLWYLGDAGQAELLAALDSERYRIELPEDAALLTVAWLLRHGLHEAALDLVAELRPGWTGCGSARGWRRRPARPAPRCTSSRSGRCGRRCAGAWCRRRSPSCARRCGSGIRCSTGWSRSGATPSKATSPRWSTTA
ncbi:hypothetical protein [Jiangella mangrovi]|uniref:Uncharacterized protein n=1 Tax=Jiangella mangrovi TaxID=1524084 RepID=A0A7W9LKY0_9ACTN|nr:hypothetical protein [Jiangella mangrovi]MBB5787527.1 hypothetical protein [Jiangella mangrovi]